MLFTQHINALTASVDNIQSQIESLEAQLRTLRSHKAEFESELQQILTLESAAESALNQSQMFINAAESLGRVDLIETFWGAMDAMQSPTIYQLPESTPDTEPEPEPEPEPDTDSPIDVTATETDTTQESEPRPLASVGSAAFNPSEASMDDLKRYVRGYWKDTKTKEYGSLTMRKTWEHAAKLIIQSL